MMRVYYFRHGHTLAFLSRKYGNFTTARRISFKLFGLCENGQFKSQVRNSDHHALNFIERKFAAPPVIKLRVCWHGSPCRHAAAHNRPRPPAGAPASAKDGAAAVLNVALKLFDRKTGTG
jgi:hypothetical protein